MFWGELERLLLATPARSCSEGAGAPSFPRTGLYRVGADLRDPTAQLLTGPVRNENLGTPSLWSCSRNVELPGGREEGTRMAPERSEP